MFNIYFCVLICHFLNGKPTFDHSINKNIQSPNILAIFKGDLPGIKSLTDSDSKKDNSLSIAGIRKKVKISSFFILLIMKKSAKFILRKATNP